VCRRYRCGGSLEGDLALTLQLKMSESSRCARHEMDAKRDFLDGRTTQATCEYAGRAKPACLRSVVDTEVCGCRRVKLQKLESSTIQVNNSAASRKKASSNRSRYKKLEGPGRAGNLLKMFVVG
jgi:hypothetical protein